MQRLANHLSEVKDNAIDPVIEKKNETSVNGGGSSNPRTKPESSDLDEIQESNPMETESSDLNEIQGSNPMETESSDLDDIQGSNPIEKESSNESDFQKSDMSYESLSYIDEKVSKEISNSKTSSPNGQRFFRGLKRSWNLDTNPKKLKNIRKLLESEKLGSYRGIAFIEKCITNPDQFCYHYHAEQLLLYTFSDQEPACAKCCKCFSRGQS